MQLSKNLFILVAGMAAVVPAAQAYEIWDGPPITFNKQADEIDDPAIVQDCLTPNVCLTRCNQYPIFNAVVDPLCERDSSGCSGLRPTGTEWAFGSTSDGVETLTFCPFLQSCFADCEPPFNILNQPAVLHLTEEDIYIDILFTYWGIGGEDQSGFTYVRSTDPGIDGKKDGKKDSGGAPSGKKDSSGSPSGKKDSGGAPSGKKDGAKDGKKRQRRYRG